MRQELKSSLGRTYIIVEPDPTNRWIDVNWTGYLTGANIRAGAAAYTEALAKSGYNAVLNDTRGVLGPWEHSLDWVINTWAPQAAASAVSFYHQLKAFRAEMFSDIEEAKKWLRQFSLSAK
jgi:hypothetical protein